MLSLGKMAKSRRPGPAKDHVGWCSTGRRGIFRLNRSFLPEKRGRDEAPPFPLNPFPTLFSVPSENPKQESIRFNLLS